MMFYELPPSETDTRLTQSDQFNTASSNLTSSNNKPATIGYATAIYDFESRYEDELSVNAGDYVLVVEAYDEWIMAQNPITHISGLIPLSYLQVVFDNASNSTRLNHPTIQTLNDYPSQSFNDTTTGMLEYDEAPIEQYQYHSMYELDKAQHDSGNNSLSSSNTMENDVTPKEESLDDFIELFGLKSSQQSTVQPTQSRTNQVKPPRPPPPTSINRPTQPLRFAPTRPSGEVLEWHLKFAKIVEELISSEISYSSELQQWEKVISQSKKLNEQQKCVLTNGYPMLQDLSQILIRSLADQFDRKPEHQCYGQMFMELRDKLTRTYSYYFRCIIEITQIMENREDKVTQDALQECLKQMRDSNVFVFDITTAIVRPINRCLKYPLFIAELLKLLPLTHIDHPKLLEAKKQMKNLVQKMNESKRRKELVKKAQTNQQDASIVNKLSKLNIHSIRKKSKRIVSSVGLSGHKKLN